MKKIYLTKCAFVLTIFGFISSCTEDDNSGKMISLEALAVPTISVVDLSNHGNASDIGIVFDSPQERITSFQVFVVKDGVSLMFSQEVAEGLDNTRYHEITNIATSYAIELPQSIKDTDGATIVENVSYRIAILSNSSDGSILSNFSPKFQLEPLTTGVFTITTFFGPQDGLDGITIDSEKNIYVSNFGVFMNGGGTGTQLFKVNKFRQKTTHASGLNVPGGCVADPDDRIYVKSGLGIQEVTQDGQKSLFASSEVGFAGLVMDEEKNIYSGVYSSSEIQKIDPNGNVSIIANDERLIGTVGIAYHQNSQMLYAANFNTGLIYAVTFQGDVSELASLGGTIGYITEMNDNLYATHFNSNQICRISLEGEITVIAGSGVKGQTDGSLLEATFNQPNGIVGDAENNVLYISDWGSPRITKIQL